MWKEFREFALRGNVLDLAIGIIIGAAFGTIINSLVNDILMPPLGLAIGNVDFSELFIVLKSGTDNSGVYNTLKDAQAAGAVTINYGKFINSIISFLIIAISIFIVVKSVNKIKRREEKAPQEAPLTKNCPYCLSAIPVKATRCAHCTSQLGTV